MWYNKTILEEVSEFWTLPPVDKDKIQGGNAMPASKAQQKAVHKYTKENYDRFLVTMKPKGRLEMIKAHAMAHSESVNGFIGRAISETMERDSAGGPQEATEWSAGAGVVSLLPDALETAQMAAEATGETVGDFLARAVEAQAQRDKSSLRLGLNPVTGDKLEKEA